MPTFQSINVSRELTKRLVAISDSNSNQITGNNHNNRNNATSIDTPQALISRHPLSLRLTNEDGTISNNPLHCNGFPELRRDVADKLVAVSRAGQRRARIQNHLQQQQQEQEQQQQQEGDDNNNNNNNNKRNFQEYSVMTTSVVSIPGTVTASDILQYQTMIATNNHSNNNVQDATTACAVVAPDSMILSTGSLALDTLLGIPMDLVTSLSSSMPRHFCIPITTSPAGLPWGHIIQCTGPSATGKTQLALSLAASAATSTRNHRGCGVLYLASAAGHGSLRPLATRLKQYGQGLTTHRSGWLDMMNRVTFQVVHDGHELLTCLAELEESFLNNDNSNNSSNNNNNSSSTEPMQQQQQYNNIRLVILDADSGCLSAEDEILLQRVALRLKILCRQYHLVIWINNASMTVTTTNEYEQNQQNYRNSNRDSIGSMVDGNFYNNNDSHAIGSTTGIAKRKAALGVAWNSRVADIHISLERLPMIKHHRTGQLQLQEQKHQHQQPQKENETVIRATLEAHPFRPRPNDGTKRTADICIQAKCIQDYSCDQVSVSLSERET